MTVFQLIANPHNPFFLQAFTARFECPRVNPRAGCNPVQDSYVRFAAPIPRATAEAIRLTRQLAEVVDDPEVHGLLALMLLHQARRPSRVDASGRLVPLAEQDRSRWDTDLIVEGVEVLQGALQRDRLGPYQTQAAIAALHADAA